MVWIKLFPRRLNTHIIGFNSDQKDKIDDENLLQYVTHQDLRSFRISFLSLLGRLPVLTYLNPLTQRHIGEDSALNRKIL